MTRKACCFGAALLAAVFALSPQQGAAEKGKLEAKPEEAAKVNALALEKAQVLARSVHGPRTERVRHEEQGPRGPHHRRRPVP